MKKSLHLYWNRLLYFLRIKKYTINMLDAHKLKLLKKLSIELKQVSKDIVAPLEITMILKIQMIS
jgi:hypothetical protein